jgi:hypothetical protein
MKAMLITFFNIKGIVHFEFIQRGNTFHKAYYVETLKQLHEDVRRKRPNDWILHHDNDPTHKMLSVKHFLAQKLITEMEHPPYYPDFSTNDLWLFQKIKSALKGQIFQDTEEIQSNVMTALNVIPQQEFQKCF